MRGKSFFSAVFSAVCLSAAILFCGAVSAQAATTVVHGTVWNANNGVVIGNADVSIYDSYIIRRANTKTGANGYFNFTRDLRNQVGIIVRVVAPNYEPQYQTGLIMPGGTYIFNFAMVPTDKSAPTGSISINNGATYTNSRNVTINLSASDTGSGMGSGAQMIFSSDNVNWTPAEPFAATKAMALSAGDGTKTIYAKFSDAVSNWSQAYSDTIILDATAPTGSVKINNDAPTTGFVNVTLNLSAQDNAGGSGLSQMRFSNDNSTWSSPETYSATKAWTLTSGDGTKTVYAKFSDAAGNWSTAYSDTIVLDTIAPSLPTINALTSPTNINSQTITGTKSADTAVITVTCPTATVGAVTYPTSTTYSCPITNLTEGTNTISVTAKDAAGNTSAAVQKSIILDRAPPTGSIKINNDAPTTDSVNVTLNLSAQDNAGGSGISQMQFSNDNVSWSVPEAYSVTKAWVLAAGYGAKTVYAKFKDVTGNWSAAYSDDIALTRPMKNYWVIVDDHDTAMPTEGQYYNYTGGDRGMLNADFMSYSRDGDSSYKATLLRQDGLWQWGGMWYSLVSNKANNVPLDFKAIFGPYVSGDYQGQVSNIAIVVKSVASPTNNSSLKLRIELKDKDENIIGTKEFFNLVAGTYDWNIPDNLRQKVKVVLWILDKAQVGDSISVDSVRLKVQSPVLNTEEEAFLWSYGWLMGNYNPATGMAQDRSNFTFGDFENVSATAKLAKAVAYADIKGYTSRADAVAIITKIADTLLNKVPRGPAGINTLWPHFTKSGGTIALPPHIDENGKHWDGTEWASGDTAYAALDMIAALQMIGDPQGQIPGFENFLKAINWQALLSPDGFISHGYKYEGNLIPYYWDAFGMETLGVNWAYSSSTGKAAEMNPPPTYNGSGFIDNAMYPVVFSGPDRYGNDWDNYRQTMANTQIGWYSSFNSYLGNSVFGLSAGETPEADGGYQAYGVGGIIPVNDGNHDVVLLHYSGMISDIKPAEAKAMWEKLRDLNVLFDTGKIVISPLNNMESMRVDRFTGKATINHLKGSWNLALQAEGWAYSDANVRAELGRAIQDNAFLKKGYDILKDTSVPENALRVPQDYPTIQAAINAAGQGDVIYVAAGTYNEVLTLDKSGITLSGTARNSVIRGVNSSPVITCSNISGPETVIKGFTIQSGAVGIQCEGTVSSLRIRDNVITRNLSETSGKGIYLLDGASATIEKNNISYCARGVEAKANNTVVINNNNFFYCRGSYGGAIYLISAKNASINRNSISGNWDGAINIYGNSLAQVYDNKISGFNNDAWGNSPGLNIYGSTVTLKNNVFQQLGTHGGPSGVLYAYGSTLNLYNNVFLGNTSPGSAAIYVYNTNLAAKNNIFKSNTGNPNYATVQFEGTGTQDFAYNDFWANVQSADTQGIALGAGNIDLDPLFVGAGDFHLGTGSSCINAGDPSVIYNDLDGTRNDMGVYGGPDSL